MRADLFTRIVFILYCIEAGIFLCWAPWSGFWERSLGGLPSLRLAALMLDPWARGAVTGFGLVHLVWGIHDLQEMVFGRPRRAPTAP